MHFAQQARDDRSLKDRVEEPTHHTEDIPGLGTDHSAVSNDLRRRHGSSSHNRAARSVGGLRSLGRSPITSFRGLMEASPPQLPTPSPQHAHRISAPTSQSRSFAGRLFRHPVAPTEARDRHQGSHHRSGSPVLRREGRTQDKGPDTRSAYLGLFKKEKVILPNTPLIHRGC